MTKSQQYRKDALNSAVTAAACIYGATVGWSFWVYLFVGCYVGSAVIEMFLAHMEEKEGD